MSPLTISVPILGLFTAVSNPSPAQIFWLGLIGFCAHLFGFALNDIIDYPIDKASPYRQKSPLVAGQISLTQAWAFVLLQLIFVVLIYVILLRGTAVGFWLLIGSLIFSIVYNVWSKVGALPRIFAEISLAISVGLLCVAGTLSVQPSINYFIISYALTLTLISLLVNSVPSGLKDIKPDQEAGASSFVLSMGCFVIAEDQLYISSRLRLYALALQVGIVCSFFVVVQQVNLLNFYKITALPILIVSTVHLTRLLHMRSFKKLRRSGPLFSGFCNYFVLLLVLIPRFPIVLQLFIGFLLIAFLVRSVSMVRRSRLDGRRRVVHL